MNQKHLLKNGYNNINLIVKSIAKNYNIIYNNIIIIIYLNLINFNKT